MFITGKPKSKKFQKFIDYKLQYILGALLIIGLLYSYKSQFIVATVNSRPITRWALVKELESQGKNQAVDSLISQGLVLQEAKNKKVNISKEELDKEVKKIRKSFETGAQKLEDILKQQNITYKVFLKQVKLQLIMNKLISGDIKVSEDAINKYIEENRSFYPEETTEADLKTSAVEQLKQKELNIKVQKLLDDLKTKANINYFNN